MIEFAELEEFVDLKLKNYSSGMLVRLAFSVMMQADADVLLIDEVLAVGDAAFQQKCADAFHEMKAAGKTIVLVTHEMSDGRGVLPPGDADRRRQDPAHRRPGRGRPPVPAAELRTRQPEDRAGPQRDRATRCGCSTPGSRTPTASAPDERRARRARSACGPSWRSLRDMPGLERRLHHRQRRRGRRLRVRRPPIDEGDGSTELAAGERVAVSAEVENLLAPGRYFVHCGVNRGHGAGVALYVAQRDRLRRLRRRAAPRGHRLAAARDRGRRRGREGAMSATEPPRRELREVARPLRPRRRLAPLLRPALADRR